MTSTYHNRLQPFLDRLLQRSKLSASEQEAVRELPTRTETITGNTDLVRDGEIIDHTIFVVEGLIGCFDSSDDGRRQITAILVPGDMANLDSVIQPQAASALQAFSAATILRIPHVALRALTAKYPAIAEAFWRDSAVDSAIMRQWLINIGRRNAKTRIAHMLCEMAVRLHAAEGRETFSFPFHVTQVQLSDVTGLTTVHVNRVLKQLRQEGLVKLGRKNADILSWSGLKKAGEFSPKYLQNEVRPQGRIRIMAAA